MGYPESVIIRASPDPVPAFCHESFLSPLHSDSCCSSSSRMTSAGPSLHHQDSGSCLSPVKEGAFLHLVPATQLCRNPNGTVQGSSPLSAFLHPHLLGGVTVATTMTFVQPPKDRALFDPSAALRRPSWLETQVSFSSIN